MVRCGVVSINEKLAFSVSHSSCIRWVHFKTSIRKLQKICQKMSKTKRQVALTQSAALDPNSLTTSWTKRNQFDLSVDIVSAIATVITSCYLP